MTDESRPADEVVEDQPSVRHDPAVTPREGHKPEVAPREGNKAEVAPREGNKAEVAPREGHKATSAQPAGRSRRGPKTWRAVRELVVIVVIALVASALLRAFVVQAYYVPSGSMLPTIHLQDRILVSRIGEVDRGEVVVFEDPGDWIPATEQPDPPGAVRSGLEWIGVLPASGHEHLVKRVVGLPGDHVVCCNADGRLVINGEPVDESDFLFQGDKRADNVSFDVVVPADHVFVLGDHRYVSGDSSRQQGQDKFVPMDLVVGRAFAVIWPAGNMRVLDVPDAYDDVPDGRTPPEKGIIKTPPAQSPRDR